MKALREKLVGMVVERAEGHDKMAQELRDGAADQERKAILLREEMRKAMRDVPEKELVS